MPVYSYRARDVVHRSGWRGGGRGPAYRGGGGAATRPDSLDTGRRRWWGVCEGAVEGKRDCDADAVRHLVSYRVQQLCAQYDKSLRPDHGTAVHYVNACAPSCIIVDYINSCNYQAWIKLTSLSGLYPEEQAVFERRCSCPLSLGTVPVA